MWIKLTHYNYASEPQTVAEISGEAFTAEAKTFAAGKTEAGRHDYDICLHILEGEFRLTLVNEGVVHSLGRAIGFSSPRACSTSKITDHCGWSSAGATDKCYW